LFALSAAGVTRRNTMYEDTSDQEIVKKKSSWRCTNRTATITGKTARVTFIPSDLCSSESPKIWYGGTREPDEAEKRSRASAKDTDEDTKSANKKKCERRNKRDLIDTLNANEEKMLAFDTFGYADIERNPDVVNHDIDVMKKRVTREVRERIDPDFVLNYVDRSAFQDGERRKDGQGRFSFHTHFIDNIPFMLVKVIVAEDKNHKNQYYLMKDGSWSKVATFENTLWFDFCSNSEHIPPNSQCEASQYLKTHRNNISPLPSGCEQIRVKNLPYLTILWGKGHVWRVWLDYERKQSDDFKVKNDTGKDVFNFGLYCASNYLAENTIAALYENGVLTAIDVQRLNGRKGWSHSQYESNADGDIVNPGGLHRPVKLRDTEVDEFVKSQGGWACITKVIWFPVDYLGHVFSITLNLWKHFHREIKTLSFADFWKKVEEFETEAGLTEEQQYWFRKYLPSEQREFELAPF